MCERIGLCLYKGFKFQEGKTEKNIVFFFENFAITEFLK